MTRPRRLASYFEGKQLSEPKMACKYRRDAWFLGPSCALFITHAHPVIVALGRDRYGLNHRRLRPISRLALLVLQCTQHLKYDSNPMCVAPTVGMWSLKGGGVDVAPSFMFVVASMFNALPVVLVCAVTKKGAIDSYSAGHPGDCSHASLQLFGRARKREVGARFIHVGHRTRSQVGVGGGT